ncbi:MAG: (Fe-S)-binding protein [Desulfobacteraceae bacterium]|nr:(Fe-S)-binding protein [Desulfobacteraceae bacterium]
MSPAPFSSVASHCSRSSPSSLCGLCLYDCPVYREEYDESVVARGRNKLITELVNREVDFTKEFDSNLELCLACKRCSMFCPAGIRADQLILAVRADLVREKGLSLLKKAAYRWLIPYM